MQFNKVIKNKNIIVTIFIFLVISLVIALALKNYKANVLNDGIKLDINQWLVIYVQERQSTGLNQGVGMIRIQNSCMPDSGGTQGGIFKCLLSSSDQTLQEFDIKKITYSSYLSGKNYTILSGWESSSAIKIKTQNQATLTIKAIIELDGTTTITYIDDNKLLIAQDMKLSHGPGDCNGDGKVDDFDFSDVVTHMGSTGSIGDCTGDGKVDDYDFSDVVTHMGMSY